MFETVTFVDQVAAHLKEELQRKRWTGQMPGRGKLASELGVNYKTVERALALLEEEGLLVSQGAGRPRRIVDFKKSLKASTRVKLILYERGESFNPYVLEIRRALLNSGHNITYAPKTFLELKQEPRRVREMIEEDPECAWIGYAASRPVLEWVAGTSVPYFALFGRMVGLSVAGAGPDMFPPLRHALRHLVDLGHTRIVMLAREERRKPDPGLVEKLFLSELKRLGVASGAYNLPDWDETPEGLNCCLDELFKVTPPTTLIVSDLEFCLSIKNYLASHRGPELRNVVVIFADYHPVFDWCIPPIPHFNWDLQPVVRRLVQWVNNVSEGRQDRKQLLHPAKFICSDQITDLR